MISLGPLAFAAPWALSALIALPLLWMLLRATPPAPRSVVFAPIRLLQRLARTPESPQTTPWWLVALRLFLAAIIILALARPVWQPDTGAGGDEPLLVIIDDGWTSAAAWPSVQAEARSRLEGARADGRPAALIFTAPSPRPVDAPRFGDAREALSRLDAHQPRAWAPDRAEAAERVSAALEQSGAPARLETLWISDGVSGGEGDRALSRAAYQHGPVRVVTPQPGTGALGLAAIEAEPDGFAAVIRRADSRGELPVSVTALGADGRALARAQAVFAAGASAVRAEARLPLDMRNRITRVVIDGEASAGAVQVMGDRWRRPRIGLLQAEGGGEDGQPLLSDLHYARQALAGISELVTGDLDRVLEAEPAGLVIVDAANAQDPRIAAFLEAGGLVVRFAGPRMAVRGGDLIPAPLREGGRLFGGAMAWDAPQPVAAFADDTPFAGLSVSEEVRVTRQVLAEPGPALDARVWARLEDGTPLVTADRRGNGWLVLFHVTAGPDWSSLPLSGLYPAMLERVLALAGGAQAQTPSIEGGAWRLERMLDGAGALTDARGDADPIPADAFTEARAGARTPPGIYTLGAASAALNVMRPGDELAPLARDLPGASYETRGEARERRLTGVLLALALIILAADVLIALALSGRLPRVPLRSASTGAAMLLAAGLAMQGEALADDAEHALEVRFAYVMTGDARIDSISRAGLAGISRESRRRSAVEPGAPAGVNIETDEILFFPLVYWPLTPDAPALSEAAAARVSAYLQSGGMIVFDTRDGRDAASSRQPHPGLLRTLERLNVPPLQRIPSDHVLGKTFYLLSDYPGRFAGSEVWVEANPDGSARDGVSGLIIGSADWASAWAVDEAGRPLAPVEGGERQREMANRFGVNLAMYALTGNYKEDQVHVPAILQRLGRR
ncbi:DUF4159 domain-containing protein [Alkalicaulis satelles]|uniref:DUF4159 domain-containing protein n=1 Tax=Alkalicaulis satelles TaxID=2609175 RepID=A0A5M6ZM92_9PROT|nr:DUF4159 domain-containing protein [Alkalicaulis satelles]KAA5804807.1 DUF4159 domain-containing protein [Alkalicaulis satelles]